MGLTFLNRRPRVCETETVIERDGATLRVAERSSAAPAWEPRVIAGGAAPRVAGGIAARAEIKAKRFSGGRCFEDRYEAMLSAADGSPSGLMAALVEAVAEVPELRQSGASDDRIILQISLIR